MKVAVTGASGHIGANLVRALLARGDTVRAIYRSDTRAFDGLDVEPWQVEITDRAGVEEALAGVEVVFHLAAFISILGERDKDQLQKINVGGPRNVVAACLKHGVRRLVHTSSIHAIRGDDPGKTVNEAGESALGEGFLQYDRSKAMGELEVQKGVAQGLDAVIVNPTSVVGPYDFKPSAQAKALIMMYHHPRLPAVKAGYNWVDVRDVAAGALLALDKGVKGERYLLGNLRLNFSEIGEMIRKATGVKVSERQIPLWMASFGVPFARLVAAMTGKRQLLTSESVQILKSHLDVSVDKAKQDLGYTPRPFQETIADTFAWYEQHGLLGGKAGKKAARAKPGDTA